MFEHLIELNSLFCFADIYFFNIYPIYELDANAKLFSCEESLEKLRLRQNSLYCLESNSGEPPPNKLMSVTSAWESYILFFLLTLEKLKQQFSGIKISLIIKSIKKCIYLNESC